MVLRTFLVDLEQQSCKIFVVVEMHQGKTTKGAEHRNI